MNALAILDAAEPAQLEHQLRAIAALDERARRGDRMDAATVALVELKAHVMALGAAGGALDALTWSAHTTAAFDRALAALAGAVTDRGALERIGKLPPPPALPAGPQTSTADPAQHALPV